MIVNKLPEATKIELTMPNTSDFINYAKIMETNQVEINLNPSQNENKVKIDFKN
jgi:hypothetical protein